MCAGKASLALVLCSVSVTLDYTDQGNAIDWGSWRTFMDQSTGTKMKYYGIIEWHNGQFNCVYAPYNTDEEAYAHIDRLRQSTYVKRSPFPITYTVTLMYAPTFVP